MAMAIAQSDDETLIVRASGAVTFQESQRIIQEISRLCESGKTLRVLADARGVTTVPTTAELRALAKGLHPLAKQGVMGVAIVTDSAFVYGVGRMFSTFAELAEANVMVFKDMMEANEWLATT